MWLTGVVAQLVDGTLVSSVIGVYWGGREERGREGGGVTTYLEAKIHILSLDLVFLLRSHNATLALVGALASCASTQYKVIVHALYYKVHTLSRVPLHVSAAVVQVNLFLRKVT